MYGDFPFEFELFWLDDFFQYKNMENSFPYCGPTLSSGAMILTNFILDYKFPFYNKLNFCFAW
jgi:hypothetical protein